MSSSTASAPHIEILVFDGCPNAEATRELVERVARELELEVDVETVLVRDANAAKRYRFLGSPTVRVNDRDIEPGAETRSDYALSCRVYRTRIGSSGQPEEAVVRDALMRFVPVGEDEVVSSALGSAGIPVERCGRERTHGLSDPERALYHWVLTHFAEQGQPRGEAFRARATELGLEWSAVADALAREDLVHFDEAGEIVVAYPFSGRPTRHQVILEAGHEVPAMCALDALGTAAMLGSAVQVQSSDPVTGEAIAVSVEANGSAAWEPAETVVLTGCAAEGPSFTGCCAVLNFFGSPASVETYLRDRPDVRGRAISVPDAVAVGSAIFGQVLASR